MEGLLRSLVVIFILSVLNNGIRDAAANKTHLCIQCTCYNSQLYSVDCENLKLKTVPPLIKDVNWKWQLKLQGNYLTSVPPFPSLENLTAISFEYNRISTTADEAFINLKNLNQLFLGHNNLTQNSFTQELFRGPAGTHYASPIQVLGLNHNSLRALPKFVFKRLENLVSLDLSNNPFGDLSFTTAGAIAELRTLQTLVLSYTGLTTLPPHFFVSLDKLKELDLSGNAFLTVPAEVNNARSLKILSLNANPFEVILSTSFLGSLKNLETLYLNESHSLLAVENGAFGNLSSLKTLGLNDNPHLSVIPSAAFTNNYQQTIHLKELNLRNNAIGTLFNFTLAWGEIDILDIEGNPWNCDCNFEWIAKSLIPVMERENFDLTTNIRCSQPPDLRGERVLGAKVQNHTFVCVELPKRADAGSIVTFCILAIISVAILVVLGRGIGKYVQRKVQSGEWKGNIVKYRRTLSSTVSEDEEMMSTSTLG